MFSWLRGLFGGVPSSDRPYSFSQRCSQCSKALEKFEGGFGGAMKQFEGVHCPACRKTWCNNCHPPQRGQQCPKCGNSLNCNFGF